MWNLKRNDTNELLTKQRLTDLENKLMVGGCVKEQLRTSGRYVHPAIFKMDNQGVGGLEKERRWRSEAC